MLFKGAVATSVIHQIINARNELKVILLWVFWQLDTCLENVAKFSCSKRFVSYSTALIEVFCFLKLIAKVTGIIGSLRRWLACPWHTENKCKASTCSEQQPHIRDTFGTNLLRWLIRVMRPLVIIPKFNMTQLYQFLCIFGIWSIEDWLCSWTKIWIITVFIHRCTYGQYRVKVV